MQVEVQDYEKEFLLTDRDFKYLSEMAYTHASIKLGPTKRELVYGRLTKRLRVLGLKNFKQYCERLKNNSEDELTHFINAVTTNVTAFFRENHHFEYLEKNLLPEIINKHKNTRSPYLRVWSAGCSSGKEPYSIAMTLKECVPDIEKWDVRILATDLDSNILEQAELGIYPEERIKDISITRKKRWFRKGTGSNAGKVKMCDEIKQLVHFRQLNLMGDWPMKGQFDIIFYRNVAIYFDKETRAKILDRMADCLSNDGHLFVGHSESLFGLTDRFKTAGRTIHKKIL